MTIQRIFADSLAVLLLISALWHIFRSSQTERWMSNRRTVRFVGGLLLLLAMPCLWWSGWFFRTLSFLLAISGIWRVGFPDHSIRVQRAAYPRRVHGCLLLGGAIAVWALQP